MHKIMLTAVAGLAVIATAATANAALSGGPANRPYAQFASDLQNGT